jgi:AhpD family alkylhydroperoxidase
MASPLTSVSWDSCLLEPRKDRELEAYARRRMGIVPPALPYLVSRPWLVRTLVNWHPEHGLLTQLDLDLADLVALTVSQENYCRYCYAATRWILRMRGLSERRVERLERDVAAGDLNERTKAALHYARALSRGTPLPDARARDDLLAAGFSRQAHQELAFVVASTELANRVHTIVAVPVRALERISTGWRPTLMRPLLNPLLSKHRRPGHPGGSQPDPDGPFSRLIESFAGSPIADVVGETMNAVSRSDVLPPGTIALIFAVVAHALDCDVSAMEARSMLPAAEADDFSQKLSHLGGSGGGETLESAVARFVRDTVWYTPLGVQQRARALLREVSTETFVEIVGLASLANALCRLAAAVRGS